MKPTSRQHFSSELKTVGSSGQISLGKKFAGKTLRLDRFEDGRIVLTAVAMVPENQLWTLAEPDRSRIERGLAWAAKTAPAETDLDLLMEPAPKTRAERKRVRQS
jgi:hypothetical protein